MLTFQQVILTLQDYWGRQGCALLQPYDMEVGAGTSHTATFLRALGPEPWRAAYVQPSRRPKDGRYGENPNRLQQYYQFQVVLKPSPPDILDLYLGSLEALGFDLAKNDVRFVEDDWENPTLGAWGLGWEVWLNGMEITQFTYFQQVGGLDCNPITGEITYGLERMRDVPAERRVGVRPEVHATTLTYRDVFYQNEVEQSKYNFEQSNAPKLFEQFAFFEGEAKRLLEAKLPLPGYEMILKAAHTFNLLDARGAISVTERAAYIGRIRKLSRLVATAYVESREALGFPMLPPTTREGDGVTNATLLVELFTEELPPKALKPPRRGLRRRRRRRNCASAASPPSNAVVTPYRDAASAAPFRSPRVPVTVTEPSRAVQAAAGQRRVRRRRRRHRCAPEGAQGHDRLRALHGRPVRPDRAADRRQAGALVLHRAARRRISALARCRKRSTQPLAELPIPKVMSYAAPGSYYNDEKFVRPAHRLVALHGTDVVAGHRPRARRPGARRTATASSAARDIDVADRRRLRRRAAGRRQGHRVVRRAPRGDRAGARRRRRTARR